MVEEVRESGEKGFVDVYVCMYRERERERVVKRAWLYREREALAWA